MENIYNFLSAAKKWGCAEQDLFQTVDLYEERNMNQVSNDDLWAIFVAGI